jgi:cell division protein FtsB
MTAMTDSPKQFVHWYWIVAILVLVVGYMFGKGVDEHLRQNEATTKDVIQLKSEVAVLKDSNQKIEDRLRSIDGKLDRLIEERKL